MSQYIIYQGVYYTIEWYYDARNKSQAREYLNELSFERKEKFYYLIRRMADYGRIANKEKFRNEGDKIFAFKPKPDRFLCFFIKDAKIIITSAFEKKVDKLPVQEKEKALWYKQDYIHRTNQETYYAKEKSK